MKRLATLGLLIGALVLGSGGCDEPSDTGFSGLWSRSESGAEVSIWREGDAWRFCWSTRPASGPQFRCDADGRTLMYEEGEIRYEYVTEVRAGAAPDVLLVRVVGRPIVPGKTPIEWVDRLELQPGGLVILAYKMELNGVPRNPAAGPLRLSKLADDRP